MVTFFITLVVYVKHMKKSKWLDCQGNEFFPKQKGTPSLVKIEHKNTATLDSTRSKKKIKSRSSATNNKYKPSKTVVSSVTPPPPPKGG